MKKRKQQQKNPKTLNDTYNSSNRYSMEMEHTKFNYDDHLANYMKRHGRAGSERVRQMNNSIAMDEVHQESKITATATARKNAPKTNPSIAEELSSTVKKSFDKTVNKFSTVAGGFLGAKFSAWSWKHMVAAGTATTAALTVGLYSGYKKQEDE
ncbi:hypothetical protein [Thiothrix lacustris]|uniref:hypothetical protein n=1 Tax=Thiothrix lacustris TaxID=525917 RepID=UPI00048C60F0|nr:hypothetical protein [Thiothrix lacustris]